MVSASSVSVQRLRPAGGLAHAVATSSASSLPVSLRSAPGRGSSFNALSRLPSTKRRLVRPTVERLTRTVRTISASQLPASAASKICARFSVRAACLPPLSIAVSSSRSAWLNSTRYRTFMPRLLVGGREESSDESKIRRDLDREAGSLSRFHPYLFVHVRTAARRGRHPAPFPRQPAVSPPDDRHPRTERLHSPSARRPTKHRDSLAARKLAYPRMARYQNVKITAMNH